MANPCIWNGKTYPSIAEAARAVGVVEITLRKWIQRGYAGDGDVNKKGHPIVINGITYPTIKAAAQFAGIKYISMTNVIEKYGDNLVCIISDRKRKWWPLDEYTIGQALREIIRLQSTIDS
jgi:hypothetical protein